MSKDINDLSNIINKTDLINIYRSLHPKTSEQYKIFEVLMEYLQK